MLEVVADECASRDLQTSRLTTDPARLGTTIRKFIDKEPKLDKGGIAWLANFQLDAPAAVAESAKLRTLVTTFNEQGSPLLKAPNKTYRNAIKRRVSNLLSSARGWAGGGS